MAILNDVLEEMKIYMEIEDTDSFNRQVIQLVNMEIGYLIRNKIPLTIINESTNGSEWELQQEPDYHTVISYIGLSVMRKFDRTLFTDASYTTNNWIDNELTDLIYHLKCIYDVG